MSGSDLVFAAESKRRLWALLALVLTVLVWGVCPAAIRSLVVTHPAADVLVLRFVVSAVAFGALLTWMSGWGIAARDWPRFLIAAATGVAGYTMLSTYAYQGTLASLGGLVLGSEPVLIALFAALFLGERLTLGVILGMGVSAAGLAVLLAQPWLWGAATTASTTATGPATGASTAGPLLMFLSGVSWSFSVVVLKPLLPTYGALRATALVSLIGTPPVLAFASPSTLATLNALSPAHGLAILFLALLGSVVSMITWNYGVRHVSAASAGVFIYAIPVVAVAGGVLVLGETLSWVEGLGGGLILAGVGLTQVAARRGS